MVEKQLEHYLMQLTEPRQDWMRHLELLATEEKVPIMEPAGIDYVRQLIRIKKPAKILEIGTAIGYSSLMMVDAYPETKVVTIEREEIRYKQAMEHIEAQQKKNEIDVIYGDALEVADIVKQQGPYDFLFIDAAKGQYKRFFEIYTPFLNEDAIVVTDNVLYKGFVAGDREDIPKRLSNIAKKIKNFNDWLINHPDYHTTIVPVGDGVAVSIRK